MSSSLPRSVRTGRGEARTGSATGVGPVAQARSWWRSHAYLLGFHLVGITGVDRRPDLSEGFWHWIQGGYQAGMHWMVRTALHRMRPQQRWPDLASMVVVAWAYHHEPPLLTHRTTRPLISCYAWATDYHRTLGRRLRMLVRWARRRWPEHWFRWYVDTGPVMEKAWAWRAGLGWIGRHGNLIHPRLGSWLFLGVVLTSLPLGSDGPAAGRDRCGTCQRCIQVCPTQAIVADGVVDARRCISYWTIEHAGPIPVPVRPLLGTHIFGCDDCQTVCPWNRWAQAAGSLRLHPAALISDATLDTWLQMDENAYRRAFAGTPVRRLGYARFVRNLVIAVGNSGEPRWLARLAQLRDRIADPGLREHITWAMQRLQEEKKKRGR